MMFKTLSSLFVVSWMAVSSLFALNGGMVASAMRGALHMADRSGVGLPVEARLILHRMAGGVDSVGSCVIRQSDCPTVVGFQQTVMQIQDASWRYSLGFGMPLMEVNRALASFSGGGLAGSSRVALGDVPLPFHDLVQSVAAMSRL